MGHFTHRCANFNEMESCDKISQSVPIEAIAIFPEFQPGNRINETFNTEYCNFKKQWWSLLRDSCEQKVGSKFIKRLFKFRVVSMHMEIRYVSTQAQTTREQRVNLHVYSLGTYRSLRFGKIINITIATDGTANISTLDSLLKLMRISARRWFVPRRVMESTL